MTHCKIKFTFMIYSLNGKRLNGPIAQHCHQKVEVTVILQLKKRASKKEAEVKRRMLSTLYKPSKISDKRILNLNTH